MGISPNVSLWLNELGHQAVHLNDELLNEYPDEAIIAKAIEENRIVLTADMDFGYLLATNKEQVVSVIQFRVTDFTPANIKMKLLLVFEKFGDQLDSPFIITVEDNRIRYRTLPI